MCVFLESKDVYHELRNEARIINTKRGSPKLIMLFSDILINVQYLLAKNPLGCDTSVTVLSPTIVQKYFSDDIWIL